MACWDAMLSHPAVLVENVEPHGLPYVYESCLIPVPRAKKLVENVDLTTTNNYNGNMNNG